MSEMEISILVNIALGIVLFALFRWKGRDDGVRLQGSAEAMQIFRSQFPDVRGEATLAADGRGALIDIEPGGAVGILERRGRRWNARVILPGDPSSAQIKRDVLCIRFADFGWPRSCLRIAEPDLRSIWLARLIRLSASAAHATGRHRYPDHA